MKLSELLSIKLEPLTPPSFKTHLNYVKCLNQLSNNLTIDINFSINSKNYKKGIIDKKVNLIKTIKKSFDEEYTHVIKNKEYAEVCCTWIAVKSYYLIFNLSLVLCSLVNCDHRNLLTTHKEIMANVKNLIKSKKLLFNQDKFNEDYPLEKIWNFKLNPKETLKNDLDIDKRFLSLLKKIAKYKLLNFSWEKKIENFKKKKDREERDKFIKNESVMAYEFFYWYRIKANYRDLEFLNQEIGVSDFYSFYENYYKLTNIFYNAFTNLINKIAKERIGNILIK